MTQVDPQVDPIIDDKIRQQQLADLAINRDALLAELKQATDAELAALVADPTAEVPADAKQLTSVKVVIPDYLTQQRAIDKQDARAAGFRTFMSNKRTELTSDNEGGKAITVPTMEERFAEYVANEPQ